MHLRFSLIISVLDSHEIVRRQCCYLSTIMPEDSELILLDDGSDPPLAMPEKWPKRFSLVYTRDSTPWTQPIARNLGARLSRGEYLFFTDIDHIVSSGSIKAVYSFSGSRMMFPRMIATLDENGSLVSDPEGLENGVVGEGRRRAPKFSVHQNTFAIRRDFFLEAMHGGYDESHCAGGKYGGDDVEFNERYSKLIESGHAGPDSLGPPIFVYPDPASSTEFHNLSRSPPLL